MAGPERAGGLGPADTPGGATTRFLVELAAWILGAWAAWHVGGPLLGVVVLIVLVALPATFNAPGDKAKDGVLVPGPVRQLLEGFLALVAVVSAGVLWGGAGVATAGALVVVAAIAGRRRSMWLLGKGKGPAHA